MAPRRSTEEGEPGPARGTPGGVAGEGAGGFPELRRWTWRTRAAGRVGVALGAQPGRRPARPDGDGRGTVGTAARWARRGAAARVQAAPARGGGGSPTSRRPRPRARVVV